MEINHIGFIMDGNRRYAKKKLLTKKKGYKLGFEKFLEIIKLQIKYKIKESSFFALSIDNIEKRPKEEINTILDILENEFLENNEILSFFKEHNIQINLKGNFKILKNKNNEISKRIIKIKDKILKKYNTQDKKDFIVNIAINYDGQDEILYSFKNILEKIKNNEIKENEITTQTIKENIFFNTSKPPEIIVRPGDAPRLSGFMLWDSKYSEIYFTKKYWPEIDEIEFKNILNWYKKIKRNFGK